MTKKPTRKSATRKRRSFFEPDSPVLTEWLAQQNDLGVSLQLIIVDAIRNYGEGDVIQAFLTARESVTGEPQVRSSLPKPNAVLHPPVVAKAAPKAPAPSIEEDAPSETAPEPQVDELPVERKPEPVKAKAAPVAQETAPQAASDDGDPLAIMFADVGSTYNGN